MSSWLDEMRGDVFGVPLLGAEMKIPQYDWDATSPEPTQQSTVPKLSKKRKSIQMTDAVPFGSDLNLSFEPLPFRRTQVLLEPEFDIGLLNELLSNKLDEENSSDDRAMMNSVRRSKVLSTPRRSEDWDSKPLESSKSFMDDAIKKRQKWLKSELKVLWTSIAIHGNNWSLVNDILTSRSYYQIKDKGRRVLYEHGWVTGRNKKDAELANVAAKEIAEKVMKQNNWTI